MKKIIIKISAIVFGIAIILFFVFSKSKKIKKTTHLQVAQVDTIGVLYPNGIYLGASAAQRIIKETPIADDDSIVWKKDTTYNVFFVDSLRDKNGKARYDTIAKSWVTVFYKKVDNSLIQETKIYFHK